MWTTQTSSRDNWERLVAAVIKRQQIWQLCHQDSITTVDSEFSQRDLSVGSGSFAPSPQLSPARSQAMKYGSRAISKNLFSTLLWRKKSKNHGLLNIPEASRFASNSSAPSNISIPSYSAERSEAEILSSPHVKAFSFNELKKATRNFRPDSLVGKGGFGYVFKGWIEEHTHSAARPGSGSVIAVKKLGGGFHGHKEWLTQVKYLGQLHHPNLVQLIGYCCDGDNRLLVYEFMPRGSLENHLFRGPEPLSWATRIKVALGAARGLSFLHEAEHQVVHRNVNASNILLDGEFNSKLGGFGSARAGPVGDSTHVSTRVMGTSGYAAPEYVAPDRLTAKSDVYSFGVMLLELLSGRRAFDKTKGAERNLVDWAKPYMNNKRRLFGMMDLRLDGQYSQKEAYTAVTIAVQCLSQEAKLRPRMAEVVLRLERLTAPKSAATGHNQGSIEIYDRNTRKERKDLESNYRD